MLWSILSLDLFIFNNRQLPYCDIKSKVTSFIVYIQFQVGSYYLLSCDVIIKYLGKLYVSSGGK